MPTARELANRVVEARQWAWAQSDPTTAVVATRKLNPDDQREVRRIVSAAGYTGDEFEPMVRQVAQLVIGQLQAQADQLPATGGD